MPEEVTVHGFDGPFTKEMHLIKKTLILLDRVFKLTLKATELEALFSLRLLIENPNKTMQSNQNAVDVLNNILTQHTRLFSTSEIETLVTLQKTITARKNREPKNIIVAHAISTSALYQCRLDPDQVNRFKAAEVLALNQVILISKLFNFSVEKCVCFFYVSYDPCLMSFYNVTKNKVKRVCRELFTTFLDKHNLLDSVGILEFSDEYENSKDPDLMAFRGNRDYRKALYAAVQVYVARHLQLYNSSPMPVPCIDEKSPRLSMQKGSALDAKHKEILTIAEWLLKKSSTCKSNAIYLLHKGTLKLEEQMLAPLCKLKQKAIKAINIKVPEALIKETVEKEELQKPRPMRSLERALTFLAPPPVSYDPDRFLKPILTLSPSASCASQISIHSTHEDEAQEYSVTAALNGFT